MLTTVELDTYLDLLVRLFDCIQGL